MPKFQTTITEEDLKTVESLMTMKHMNRAQLLRYALRLVAMREGLIPVHDEKTLDDVKKVDE